MPPGGDRRGSGRGQPATPVAPDNGKSLQLQLLDLLQLLLEHLFQRSQHPPFLRLLPVLPRPLMLLLKIVVETVEPRQHKLMMKILTATVMLLWTQY